jgi:hypothetical protein
MHLPFSQDPEPVTCTSHSHKILSQLHAPPILTRSIVRCSLRSSVSEEHVMGTPIYVCLSVAFSLEVSNLHDRGIIVTQQWEPILLLILLLLLLLLFLCLAFAGLDTPLPLSSQVRSSRSQDYLDWPRGALPPTGLGHFRGLSPLRGAPS